MGDFHYGQQSIGHAALYVPQLWVILFVALHLHRDGLTHIRMHAASYSCCVRFYLPCSNSRPGSYSRWLQLQHRGGLTGVCGAAVSHRVAHWLECLSFSSIRLQSHLVEVFLEPWLDVVERWGRWSPEEVGSPQDYIVSYKSKWNEWQPTCTFNSSWILLGIAALQLAGGDPNGPAIGSKLVQCCVYVYSHTLWWTKADISCLIDIKRTFSDWKDVWRCLSQDIAGILHESHADHQVMVYG